MTPLTPGVASGVITTPTSAAAPPLRVVVTAAVEAASRLASEVSSVLVELLRVDVVSVEVGLLLAVLLRNLHRLEKIISGDLT